MSVKKAAKKVAKKKAVKKVASLAADVTIATLTSAASLALSMAHGMKAEGRVAEAAGATKVYYALNKLIAARAREVKAGG